MKMAYESGIIFTYGIEIKKLFARWKGYCKGYMIIHLIWENKMFLVGLMFLCSSMVFISIYGKVKEVLIDLGFDGLGFNPRV